MLYGVCSGRQFIIAEDILFTGGYPSYGDSLDAGIQCFLLAIEVGLHSVCVEHSIRFKVISLGSL